uniref:SMEK domain-containing protein n=1 Tax=Candidatus Kentrum sp. TC TaxID=2126339 RepID=A0A450Z0Q1_9GAMM|nr:MAG: hypothetical protein BECKTC1821D_GA0114238_104514 [Candidatus Kentron sp. TC]
MNRRKYFDFIEEKLNLLAVRIERRGGLNLLDLNLHSENFYRDFLNLLFDWKLRNLNAERKNASGVDLIDTNNRIVAQVSATATKQKIESALANVPSEYKSYAFKFLSISKDATDLRGKSFSNPHGPAFSPREDIFDVQSLLNFISDLDTERLVRVDAFLKKELKSEPDPEKIASNLATIIELLSKEDWREGATDFETAPYDIEAKISYNELHEASSIIEDYKIHHARIDKIYSEFDEQGANKSLSILGRIRKYYVDLGVEDPPDRRFLMVVDEVTREIRASANYNPISEEELGLCVEILVVDAFIRCKIFKNPSGYAYARP